MSATSAGGAILRLFSSPVWVARTPILTTILLEAANFQQLWQMWVVDHGAEGQSLAGWVSVQIALWLWFTVMFANFAEAMAEGRGKAQADNLRKTRTETQATVLRDDHEIKVPATSLRRGDVVMVRAGEMIPGDGEVVEGVAAVNEAAITGESAPVIRESGGDRSAVTGGTRVLSDRIVIRITAEIGRASCRERV